MNTLRNFRTFVLLAVLTLPLMGMAEDDGSGVIKNPLGDKNNDLFKFLNTAIDAVLKLGAIIAVLAIIFAGFKFVTAGGDEKQLETAKKILLYSVIGIAILLGARAISSVVINTVTEVGKAAK